MKSRKRRKPAPRQSRDRTTHSSRRTAPRVASLRGDGASAPSRDARRRIRRSFRPGIERLESRQLLAADLQLADVYLVDSDGSRINEPALGQQMYLRADYNTTDLASNASYRLEIQVDGVPLTIGGLSVGAGSSSGSGSVTLGGWYATKPQHQVFARVDADNSVIEADEANNALLVSLNSAAALPPSKFIWPLGADLFTEMGVKTYVDLDPRTGEIQDYRGGSAATDGSQGLAVGPATFHEQDLGIPVYAAAGGVVISATDGRTDRNTGGFGQDNFVIIDHGNDWITEYRNLRRDSLTVTVNDLVQQGDLIGMLGASGNAAGPQMRFLMRQRGTQFNRYVDPLVDPATFLTAAPPAYVYDAPSIYDSGITNYDPTAHLQERPSDLLIWNTGIGSTSHVWAAFAGLKEDDVVEVVWRKPDGTEHLPAGTMRISETITQDTPNSVRQYQQTLPAQLDQGMWRVEFLVNGVKLREQTFTAVATGQPEIRVEQGGAIVLDDRYSPIDFGFRDLRNNFFPTRSFTVTNHGGGLLTLSRLTVPNGFTVVDGLVPALTPGSSDTLTVSFTATTVGQHSGEIKFQTNDAGEEDYRFSIEGNVFDGTTFNRLTLGIAERMIDEGGRTTASVRRTGFGFSPLVVTLASDDPQELSLPATVTIPAGTDRAVFVIDGLVDGILDGIDTVNITATAAGFAPGRSTLDVFDFANDAPTITPIADQTIDEDTTAGPITFTIGDTETLASQLSVVASSSNTTLVPNANISLAGTGAIRTITLTPAADQFGVTTISVVVTDAGGLPTTETFDLTVTNVNDPPTEVVLVPDAIDENTNTSGGNVAVGALRVTDADPADPWTFALVSGAGSTDNALFIINGDILNVRRNIALNHEAQSSYSVRVQVDDGAVLFEKALTVFVNDLPEPPTGVSLSNNIIDENIDTRTAPAFVGTLSAVDPDANSAHAFALVPGAGGADNGKFQITGNALEVRQGVIVDFETQPTFSIRVQASDAAGSIEQVFTINVNDRPEVVVMLDNGSISEAGGVTAARVVRSDANGDALVTLASDDTSEATVIASILIPNGQTTSADFNVVAVDDMLLDGAQLVYISASAAGYQTTFAPLTVTDFEPLSFTLADAAIPEAGGVTAGRVRRTDSTGDLTVTLASSDTSEATLPATITILDGQLESGLVTVTAVDDSLVDGAQPVTLTASAPGYGNGTANLQVLDVELLTLTLNAASISENNGMTTAVVQRTDATGSLTVTLSSSDATAATVPASIVIPAGQLQSAPFVVTAVDDGLLDGPQTTVIRAAAAGYMDATQTLTVTDHEQLAISLATGSISENGGATTATVSRGTETRGSLTVTLVSSDASEAIVPASVTIPDGATTSSPFAVTARDDNVLDGTQIAVISATATGYVAGTSSINVTDFEPLTITIDSNSISENGGTTTFRVSRTNAASAVVVNLSSSDTSEATVPAVVLLNVGQLVSPILSISAVDDALLDGDQPVTITATASGYEPATGPLTVTDFEPLSLNIQTTSVAEGQTTTATVTRTDASSSLTVALVSSDTTELTVPATITIPAGQTTSSPIVLAAVQDNVLDGTQTVSLTASAAGYRDALGSLSVRDARGLNVSLASASISENGGATTATITRSDTIGSITVQLASSNTSEASIPSTVTILNGESSSAPVPISAVDDALLDGTQVVMIRASAAGYDDGVADLSVTDHEALVVSIPNSVILEQGGSSLATVTRTDTRGDLVVSLSSSDVNEATVPASVTILNGQASASFTVSAVNDGVPDGTKTVTITASAAGYISGGDAVDVSEERRLTLTLNSNRISENGGTTTAMVSRTDTVGALTVTISIDDVSEASAPSTVTIPDGQTVSAPFTITGVDDNLLDGDQTATLTAGAAGYSSDSKGLTVADHEALTFSIAVLPLLEMQRANVVVSRGNTNAAQPLVIALSSASAGQLTMPGNVTIPANASGVSFTVEALWDNVVEGTQQIAIMGSAGGYVDAVARVDISDNGKPYQNPNDRLNVNDDPAGQISPVDANIVITELNLRGARVLPPPTSRPVHFIDPSGDNELSAVDALLVIIKLNEQAQGEGEAAEAAREFLSGLETTSTQFAAPHFVSPQIESSEFVSSQFVSARFAAPFGPTATRAVHSASDTRRLLAEAAAFPKASDVQRDRVSSPIGAQGRTGSLSSSVGLSVDAAIGLSSRRLASAWWSETTPLFPSYESGTPKYLRFEPDAKRRETESMRSTATSRDDLDASPSDSAIGAPCASSLSERADQFFQSFASQKDESWMDGTDDAWASFAHEADVRGRSGASRDRAFSEWEKG